MSNSCLYNQKHSEDTSLFKGKKSDFALILGGSFQISDVYIFTVPLEQLLALYSLEAAPRSIELN